MSFCILTSPLLVGLDRPCYLLYLSTLLKAGVSIDSKFTGVLQIRNNKPLRFTNLIYYSGSTLGPSEVFIQARMSDVRGAIREGEGKLMANFGEIPAQCQPLVKGIINQLKEAGLGGVMVSYLEWCCFLDNVSS